MSLVCSRPSVCYCSHLRVRSYVGSVSLLLASSLLRRFLTFPNTLSLRDVSLLARFCSVGLIPSGGSAVLYRLCDPLPRGCLGDHPFVVAIGVAPDRQVSERRTYLFSPCCCLGLRRFESTSMIRAFGGSARLGSRWACFLTVLFTAGDLQYGLLSLAYLCALPRCHLAYTVRLAAMVWPLMLVPYCQPLCAPVRRHHVWDCGLP